jgi:hypothetical protein
MSQNARLMRALDLSTFQVSNVMSPFQMGSTAEDTAICKFDSVLFFSAAKDDLVRVEEIWSLDQNSGKAAQVISSLGSGNSWYSRDLTLSADCSTLSISAGQSVDKTHLWRLDLPSKKATQVTKLPKRFSRWRAHSPDGLTLVYGSGASLEAMTLKAVPAVGGAEATIDGQAGELRIFTAY